MDGKENRMKIEQIENKISIVEIRERERKREIEREREREGERENSRISLSLSLHSPLLSPSFSMCPYLSSLISLSTPLPLCFHFSFPVSLLPSQFPLPLSFSLSLSLLVSYFYVYTPIICTYVIFHNFVRIPIREHNVMAAVEMIVCVLLFFFKEV
jgi:hypothetical protein